jgi:hypothetical protein
MYRKDCGKKCVLSNFNSEPDTVPEEQRKTAKIINNIVRLQSDTLIFISPV